MLVVVALGGNALLRRGEDVTAKNQRENVQKAVKVLAELVREGHHLVITHGNGPQIGLLALQNHAYDADSIFPLDILGAESEGMIGYLIEQELENQLGDNYSVATLLTQIAVDPDDPGFDNPSKFIGPVYDEEQANKLKQRHGWILAKDGDDWRRVVPSPEPREILDLKILKLLLAEQVITICIGGGGIPIVRQPDGTYRGVEAVIDKDAASALLAEQVNADALLLLTDVAAVYHDFGGPDEHAIEAMTVSEAEQFEAPQGSMGPKLIAAARFVRAGRFSAIGAMEDALDLVQGNAGTRITEG
ncbi:carbamate kinase [Pseudidiomarina terrestris]|uniref:carbamate kinase n=1 Tax=Pseudidiomarina terrestris TaxID=2820060 RepID=UPI0026519815|nr:carbamate kinase [Pseudidiomarina sp. 1ASP75-5]MDN7136114.1 carbamate kinase [Pseudidiomarina sp. 1ASP75-5]